MKAILVVRFQKPGPTPALQRGLAGSFVSFLCMVFFTAIGATEAKRRASEAVRHSLVKGLQFGLAISDDADRIVYANDRAQAIVGVTLPRGGRRAREGIAFSDVICPWIVAEDADGKLGEVMNYSPAVSESRKAGITSAYYAKLKIGKRKGKWIGISGAPIFDPLRSGGSVKTFAILRKKLSVSAEELEERVGRFQAGGSRGSGGGAS